MSVSHTIKTTYSRGTGPQIVSTSQIAAEGDDYINLDVAAASTNLQIDLAIVRARLKSIMITVTSALTLKTNSTSAPDNTFALLADKPLIWNVDSLTADPFGADVTTIYVTTPSGPSVNLQIVTLFDRTP